MVNISPKKGRPVRSVIRQNIVEILYYLEKGYGYQISRIYNEIFPKVTQRVVYYHLQKGIQTKEIELKEIQREQGEFSWGTEVEKKIYCLGKSAMPKGEQRIKSHVDTLQRK
ncbi:hypothetical protein HYX12_03365 [Candidatus Woesearchaeota archaeon]|nr:hypothetical protein [Candidatus Woesearchaeota archaeon]